MLSAILGQHQNGAIVARNARGSRIMVARGADGHPVGTGRPGTAARSRAGAWRSPRRGVSRWFHPVGASPGERPCQEVGSAAGHDDPRHLGLLRCRNIGPRLSSHDAGRPAASLTGLSHGRCFNGSPHPAARWAHRTSRRISRLPWLPLQRPRCGGDGSIRAKSDAVSVLRTARGHAIHTSMSRP